MAGIREEFWGTYSEKVLPEKERRDKIESVIFSCNCNTNNFFMSLIVVDLKKSIQK